MGRGSGSLGKEGNKTLSVDPSNSSVIKAFFCWSLIPTSIACEICPLLQKNVSLHSGGNMIFGTSQALPLHLHEDRPMIWPIDIAHILFPSTLLAPPTSHTKFPCVLRDYQACYHCWPSTGILHPRIARGMLITECLLCSGTVLCTLCIN